MKFNAVLDDIVSYEAGKPIELVVRDFGIESKEFGVAVMVAFGYRVDVQKTKTRQNMEAITTWYE